MTHDKFILLGVYIEIKNMFYRDHIQLRINTLVKRHVGEISDPPLNCND